MVRTNKNSSVWTAKKSLTLSKQIYCSKKRRKLPGAMIERILKIQIQICFFFGGGGHNAASNSTHLPMFRKCLLPSSAEIYSETEHEARSSRRSVTIYQVTSHIPENSYLCQHFWQNLKCERVSQSSSCSNHSRLRSIFIFRTNNNKILNIYLLIVD
jgi:hypothetical protein